jgi:hypothetical protein
MKSDEEGVGFWLAKLVPIVEHYVNPARLCDHLNQNHSSRYNSIEVEELLFEIPRRTRAIRLISLSIEHSGSNDCIDINYEKKSEKDLRNKWKTNSYFLD